MISPYKIRNSYFGGFSPDSLEAKFLSHSPKMYGIFYKQGSEYKNFWAVRLIQGNSIIVVLSEKHYILIQYNIPLTILYGEII